VSTRDPWDTSGYGPAGGGRPQGQPGSPGGPGYPGYGNAAGQWSGAVPEARLARGRSLRIAAMVLFFLAALANALGVFGPDQAWKNPLDELYTVVLTLLCLLAACMLLPAKTCGLGAGLALAQALVESARFVNEVTPSGFDGFNLLLKLAFTGAYVLTALGGLAVVIALAIERGPSERGVRMPLPVLLLGIPGTVLCTLGLVRTQYVWTYEGTSPQSFPCCSWSASVGIEKTSYVLFAVAVLAIVLLAAFVAVPGLAKGLLAGIAVLALVEGVTNVVSVLLPDSAAYGFGGGDGQPAISAQAQSGLWIFLVGLVLFAIAFFIQRGGGAFQPVPATPQPPPYYPQWQQPTSPMPQQPSAPQQFPLPQQQPLMPPQQTPTPPPPADPRSSSGPPM
jgi:hypothetical protein